MNLREFLQEFSYYISVTDVIIIISIYVFF